MALPALPVFAAGLQPGYSWVAVGSTRGPGQTRTGGSEQRADWMAQGEPNEALTLKLVVPSGRAELIRETWLTSLTGWV